METFADYGIELPAEASGETDTLCPKCSPTRKKSRERCLSVNVTKGTWYCQHCGWKDGLKDEKYQGMACPAPPAAPKKPSYRPANDLQEYAYKFFEGRGISRLVVDANRIGFGQSWRDMKGIQFPYLKGGVVVNIKHRGKDKRFRQERDAEKCLYRYDEISKCKLTSLDGGKNYEKILIVTEGEIDALSYQEAGLDMVTSIPDGAPTADSENYTTKFDFLKSAETIIECYDKVILATDDDPNGHKAEFELSRRIGIERCWRVKYPSKCKDANDVLLTCGADALFDTIRKAEPMPVKGSYSPANFIDRIKARIAGQTIQGTLTGWPNLDEYYTVLPGQLTVVTGIPGHGKSEFLDALAINLARDAGWRFAIFSPENMPFEIHVAKLIEKIEFKRLSGIKPEDAEYTINMINDYFEFIRPESDLVNLDAVLELARVNIFRKGIQGLIIDPWNELEHDYRGLTEAQFLSQELSKIRWFARKNQIHIWVVAHPHKLQKDKEGEYRPPTMYEISGGAHWRNKADNGICVHRPAFPGTVTDVHIQKVRLKEIGKAGLVSFRYDPYTTNYKPMPRENDYEQTYIDN